MNDSAKRQKAYKILAVVFAIGGLVWIIGGIISFHFILYPFLGLLNWLVALYCHQMGKTA